MYVSIHQVTHLFIALIRCVNTTARYRKAGSLVQDMGAELPGTGEHKKMKHLLPQSTDNNTEPPVSISVNIPQKQCPAFPLSAEHQADSIYYSKHAAMYLGQTAVETWPVNAGRFTGSALITGAKLALMLPFVLSNSFLREDSLTGMM